MVGGPALASRTPLPMPAAVSPRLLILFSVLIPALLLGGCASGDPQLTGPNSELAPTQQLEATPLGLGQEPGIEASASTQPLAAHRVTPVLEPSTPAARAMPDTTPSAHPEPQVSTPEPALSSIPLGSGEPVVALTFDDGPHPSNTPRVLDILAEKGVHATFFLVGSQAQAHPEIVRRILAEGHEIGNHSWDHPDLVDLERSQGAEAVTDQIERTTAVIEEISGQRPIAFRPPYRRYNERMRVWCRDDYHMPVMLWDVDPLDWQAPPPATITSRLVEGARAGSILLLHDVKTNSVDAVPATIDQLRARGLRFVTISEMMHLDASGAVNSPSYPASPESAAAASR